MTSDRYVDMETVLFSLLAIVALPAILRLRENIFHLCDRSNPCFKGMRTFCGLRVKSILGVRCCILSICLCIVFKSLHHFLFIFQQSCLLSQQELLRAFQDDNPNARRPFRSPSPEVQPPKIEEIIVDDDKGSGKFESLAMILQIFVAHFLKWAVKTF